MVQFLIRLCKTDIGKLNKVLLDLLVKKEGMKEIVYGKGSQMIIHNLPPNPKFESVYKLRAP